MAKLSKKQQKIREKVKLNHLYNAVEAIEVLKEFASSKFKESFDVSFNLGVDPRKSDQVVRGASVLPHGTGKTVRVAVFAQGANAEAAKAAGADIVGFDDLVASVQAGNLDFDVVIATPDMMREVGKLGKVLGPRGLMPTPKAGTVTTDVATAVQEIKKGKIEFKLDKHGVANNGVGKLSFSKDAIVENIRALLAAIMRAKPASAKGQYVVSIVVSSTMGPGLKIDRSEIPAT